MGGKSQEIHIILYNFLQKPGLWKDSGAERAALEASAPGKNGEDLTSEEFNGLGLPVRRLNPEKLLVLSFRFISFKVGVRWEASTQQ